MYIDPIDEHRDDIAKGDHARDTSYTIFAADMGNALGLRGDGATWRRKSPTGQV